MPFLVHVKSWHGAWQIQEMARYLQMRELAQRPLLAVSAPIDFSNTQRGSWFSLVWKRADVDLPICCLQFFHPLVGGPSSALTIGWFKARPLGVGGCSFLFNIILKSRLSPQHA
jgi:hypothetical protein